MALQRKEWTIVDGPSKFDLMVSLFTTEQHPSIVKFRVEDADGRRSEAGVAVTMVRRLLKENDDEKWEMEGHPMPPCVTGHSFFEARFSTKDRKGSASVEWSD